MRNGATERRPSSPGSDRTIPLSARKAGFLLASAAALWGIAVWLWLQGGIDRAIQFGHNPLRGNSSFADAAALLSAHGMALCIGIILVYCVFFPEPGRWTDMRKICLPVVLSFAIAGIVGDVSKGIFARPRPFQQYAGDIVPLDRPEGYSLPSGHTTRSFALILPVLLFVGGRSRRRKVFQAVLLLAALCVAYSRIALGVHFLSDILAGIGTALLVLPLVVRIANRVYSGSHMDESRLRRVSNACGFLLFGLMIYFILI
jgi:membrane-associated phospholipid phosphatase